MFGEQVALTFYRRQPDAVAQLLDEAGLKPYAGMVREPNDDGFESYTQSARIIAEFCEEAISLIERDGTCHLSWSG